MERCDDETRDNTNSVVEKLRDAGTIVEEVSLPVDFDAALLEQRALMSVEGAQVHESNFAVRADDFSANVHGLIEQGLATLRADIPEGEALSAGVQAWCTGGDSGL